MTTFWICWASSRVGARMRDWHSRSLGSSLARVPMAKVAVLPCVYVSRTRKRKSIEVRCPHCSKYKGQRVMIDSKQKWRVRFRVGFVYTTRVTLFGLERWCYFQRSSFPFFLPSISLWPTQMQIIHIFFTHRTRLSLCNQITAQHGGFDSPLLNSRGFLKTVGINTTKQFFGNFHTIESIDSFIPVGVDVGISDAARRGFAPVVGLCRWLFTVDIMLRLHKMI